ncbi:Nn.00g078600.m01.CDS01 [Neocucurbitaria sp. VM-36]
MSVATDGLNDVYDALERYNWDDDVEFQSGLSAILGSNSSPDQAAELALRARCFYYARKYNKNIDFDAYKAYRNARNRPPPTPPTTTTTTNGAQAPSQDPVGLASTDTAGGIMPVPANPAEPPAPYPTSFAQIVELITSGQPIPGIKEIPPTVLTGQGTEPAKARRKKPWEKEEAATTTTQEVGHTGLS